MALDRTPAANATVLVCRGCCCGTTRKHPDVSHDDHLARLVAAVDGSPGLRLRVTDCLGPCERSNVVVVRPHGCSVPGRRRAVWFGGMLDDEIVEELADWLRAGGAARRLLTAALAERAFDPHRIDPAPGSPASNRAGRRRPA